MIHAAAKKIYWEGLKVFREIYSAYLRLFHKGLGTLGKLPRPGRVLFVCHGNICRSAFAEVYFRHQTLHYQQLRHTNVASAGLKTTAGKPANETAIRIAAEMGIDLSGHQTQCVTPELLDKSDIIFVFEKWHREGIRRQFPSHRHKCVYLGWLHSTHPTRHIPDPYNKDESTFRETFRFIQNAIDQMIRFYEGEED